MNINVYGLRLVKESSGNYEVDKATFMSPEVSYKLVEDLFQLSTRPEETFVLITLTVKFKITGAFIVSQGSVSETLIHPREIFKRALLTNSSAVMLVHNHPSGDSTPSELDKKATDRLVKAGSVMGIRILDHIIVGDNEVFSFRNSGMIADE